MFDFDVVTGPTPPMQCPLKDDHKPAPAAGSPGPQGNGAAVAATPPRHEADHSFRR